MIIQLHVALPRVPLRLTGARRRKSGRLDCNEFAPLGKCAPRAFAVLGRRTVGLIPFRFGCLPRLGRLTAVMAVAGLFLGNASLADSPMRPCGIVVVPG